MILSAHQSAYNPWLGLIHKMLISDVFVVMDDVQFEKNSFTNRNKILQNEQELMLTIPLKVRGYKSKSIKDMETTGSYWKKKHLKSIKQAYSKSALFHEVFELIETIYKQESNFLIDYTNNYLFFIRKYLDIDTKIVFASDLNIVSKKLDYVVEMSKKLNAKYFVFGSLGKNYADSDYLQKKSINPYFQNYNHPAYGQNSKIFHPYMGILDILFNERRENIKDIIFGNNITKKQLKDLYA